MILSTLIEALAQILHMLITLYIWIVIIATLISWVRPDPYNPIVQVLARLTEPLYYQMRSRFPTSFSGIDFAPLIIIIALQFLDLFVVKLLFALAHSL